MTDSGARGWAREHLAVVRVALFVLAVAAGVGVGALTGVLLGDGPADGIGHVIGPIIGLTLFYGFQAYRAHTAPRREQRRQRERAAYEATHRGDGGQGTT